MQKGKARALGKSDQEILKADLEKYRAQALALGAATAAIIPASDVNIDERVRLKCLVPRCLRAGETPSCPPYGLDLELVRRALARFSWAVLVRCNVEPIEDYMPGSHNKAGVLAYHQKSAGIVYEIERQAFKDGYYLAMGFGGGSCKDYLCKGLVCQFLDSGRCRFQHRSRPAMEAAGIDVIDLVNKAGWQSYPVMDDVSEIPCAISVGIVFIQ